LAEVEGAALAALTAVRANGITPEEFARAKYQLRARYVFESDSVTNIAHQLGYFQTVATVDLYRGFVESLEGVTLDDVARAAAQYLAPAQQTIGWFQPQTETAR
jgi:zinc protease